MKPNLLLALLLLLTFSACQKSYFLIGATRDAGNFGLSDSSFPDARDDRIKPIAGFEFGHEVAKNSFLVANVSRNGYGSDNGSPINILAIEYNHLIPLKEQLSIVLGVGAGVQFRFPRYIADSPQFLPLRLGVYYDIPIGDVLELRLGLLDRPQLDVSNSEFNNGISFMAGITF